MAGAWFEDVPGLIMQVFKSTGVAGKRGYPGYIFSELPAIGDRVTGTVGPPYGSHCTNPQDALRRF